MVVKLPAAVMLLGFLMGNPVNERQVPLPGLSCAADQVPISDQLLEIGRQEQLCRQSA